MLEVFGDLWTHMPADARCITTNGVVNAAGRAVMGRGCARQAAERFPHLPRTLGSELERKGNHVHLLDVLPDETLLFSFPVKHCWIEDADIELIARSAAELVALVNRFGLRNVVVPRPGCGNGRLSWERVRGVLAELLDDRFRAISPGRAR